MTETPLLIDMEIAELEKEIERLRISNMTLSDACVQHIQKVKDYEKLEKSNQELFDLCIKMHNCLKLEDETVGLSDKSLEVYHEVLAYFGA